LKPKLNRSAQLIHIKLIWQQQAIGITTAKYLTLITKSTLFEVI